MCAYNNPNPNPKGGQAGAETITIEKPLSTVYTLFLDNYSGALGGWRTLESAIQGTTLIKHVQAANCKPAPRHSLHLALILAFPPVSSTRPL